MISYKLLFLAPLAVFGGEECGDYLGDATACENEGCVYDFDNDHCNPNAAPTCTAFVSHDTPTGCDCVITNSNGDPTESSPTAEPAETTTPPDPTTPAAEPSTPHPHLEPKWGYTRFVRPPIKEGITSSWQCHEECEKDKTTNGDCDDFEYDHNYGTCWLYKKEYTPPHFSWSEFTEDERFEWAQFNAALPYYRTVIRHNAFLKVPLQEWWQVSLQEMGYDFEQEEGEFNALETSTFNMQLRQQILLEKLMLAKPGPDKEPMKLLINKLFGKVDKGVQVDLLKLLEGRRRLTDRRRLVAFGEMSA